MNTYVFIYLYLLKKGEKKRKNKNKKRPENSFLTNPKDLAKLFSLLKQNFLNHLECHGHSKC